MKAWLNRLPAAPRDTAAMSTRRLARSLPLILASLVLTVVGAVLIFTGHTAPGAALLAVAQPINVFIALRSHAAPTDYVGTQRPPK
jgi:peptidoglycan/LPS O-acetylase OafA/YrhL